MKTTNYLSQENLDTIKAAIQLELLKRGVTAPIVKLEETTGRNQGCDHYINLETEPFQTVPVMFKKLMVSSFSTHVSKRKRSELKEGLEGDFISVWISVHYSYESFSGGSNGTELFDINFNVFGDDSYSTKVASIR